jgi:hypothetical protein
MSSGGGMAVLEPEVVDSDGWVSLDDWTVSFESQFDMRSGARSYSPEQARFIQLAVSERAPLPESPVQLDD